MERLCAEEPEEPPQRVALARAFVLLGGLDRKFSDLRPKAGPAWALVDDGFLDEFLQPLLGELTDSEAARFPTSKMIKILLFF